MSTLGGSPVRLLEDTPGETIRGTGHYVVEVTQHRTATVDVDAPSHHGAITTAIATMETAPDSDWDTFSMVGEVVEASPE